MNSKWKFWNNIVKYAEKQRQKAYMLGPDNRGNCDSKCPKCNLWESSGNIIYTESQKDGSELRTCNNCGHTWRAIFTPAGFIEV